MQLHKISERYKEIQELEGIPDDALADTLESIEGEIQEKGQNIGLLIENWESDIKALTEHKNAVQARINARKARIESLKDYLRENMEATGIKKIEHPLFTISCVEGRENAVIDNAEDLPDDLVKVDVTVKPVKAEITKALKAGEDVPGAHLEKSKSSIRIRK